MAANVQLSTNFAKAPPWDQLKYDGYSQQIKQQTHKLLILTGPKRNTGVAGEQESGLYLSQAPQMRCLCNVKYFLACKKRKTLGPAQV